MVAVAAPEGLGPGGLALWESYAAAGLSVAQVALLVEACRAKDRLDKLDGLLRGDVDVWARLTHNVRTDDYELRIDDALVKANATSASLRQLLAGLPADAGVAKPQVTNALDELTKRRKDRGSGSTGRARPARG